jgi:hypothetical protein
MLPDGFNGCRARRAIADDNNPHSYVFSVEASSHKIRARVGQAAMQAGVSRSGQRSHFSAWCLFPFRLMAPTGHTIMQDQQPTHFSRSTIMFPVPSSLRMPPEMQARAHTGSSQWRHWMAIARTRRSVPLSSIASTWILGWIVASARIAFRRLRPGACAAAHASSQDRQARHFSISQKILFMIRPGVSEPLS